MAEYDHVQCDQTTMDKMDAKKLNYLFFLHRFNINQTTGIIGGHCSMQSHGKRMGYHHNDICRNYGNEEENVEDIVQSLYHCPVLTSSRHKFLGKNFFDCRAKPALAIIDHLVAFIRHTK